MFHIFYDYNISSLNIIIFINFEIEIDYFAANHTPKGFYNINEIICYILILINRCFCFMKAIIWYWNYLNISFINCLRIFYYYRTQYFNVYFKYAAANYQINWIVYHRDIRACKWLFICMDSKMSIKFIYTFKYFHAHLFFLGFFFWKTIFFRNVFFEFILFASALEQFVNFFLVVLSYVIHEELIWTWHHFLDIR